STSAPTSTARCATARTTTPTTAACRWRCWVTTSPARQPPAPAAGYGNPACAWTTPRPADSSRPSSSSRAPTPCTPSATPPPTAAPRRSGCSASSTKAAAERGSEAVAQETAVHADAFAGDVAGRRQAKEGDRRRHLLRFAHAAHRRAVQHLVEVIGIGQLGRRAAGADVPGRDRVHPHAVLGPFAGQVPGQLVQRRLGHAV